jgi:hypothetical protein
MFIVFHELTSTIAKMYYETQNESFKSNAMDLLSLINGSEKFARLLENVQHPANQNIYMESKRLAGRETKGSGGAFGGRGEDAESG